VETVLKEHVNVKKVVLVDAIMQKKIVNVEIARQEIVIAISMLHNIFTKKEIWYFLPNLFFINLKLSKSN
jgi:hypothetical protein